VAAFAWFLLSTFTPQEALAALKGPGGTSELQTIEKRQQWSRLPSVVTWNEKPNAALNLHEEEPGSEHDSSTTIPRDSVRMPGLGVFLLSAGASGKADAKSCSGSNRAWLQMLWRPRVAALAPAGWSHTQMTGAGCHSRRGLLSLR